MCICRYMFTYKYMKCHRGTLEACEPGAGSCQPISCVVGCNRCVLANESSRLGCGHLIPSLLQTVAGECRGCGFFAI